MVISTEMRGRIRAQMARYPATRGALLPALHLVQRERGYIDRQTMVELAELFDLHPIQVKEVINFYNLFYDRPQGRHHVNVCTNLPCSLRGARMLLRELESHLGIRTGETTPDGRITLGHEECLGACGWAPVLRIDETYHEDLDTQQAKQILDALE